MTATLELEFDLDMSFFLFLFFLLVFVHILRYETQLTDHSTRACLFVDLLQSLLTEFTFESKYYLS